MKVGLESVVSYMPERVITREERSYLDAVIPEEHLPMFKGPDEVRRLNDENAVEIMAETVTRQALEEAALKPADIDFIVSGNIGGKKLFPMVGSYIHEKVGFDKSTPVVNIQNFCASFVDAVYLAWNLVLSGRHKRVLVSAVTSVGPAAAKTGWGVDQTSPSGKFCGDGSGAAVVSSENLKCEFLSYANRTLGEMYDHMRMEYMQVMNPQLREKAGVEADAGIYLTMDEWAMGFGMGLGKTIMMPTIEEALRQAGLTLADLDMVILHHPMDLFHETWIRDGIAAGIGPEKWKLAYDTIGNCGNVDIAYKLAELSAQKVIPKGSIVALYPPGLGGHTPCMIIRWLG